MSKKSAERWGLGEAQQATLLNQGTFEVNDYPGARESVGFFKGHARGSLPSPVVQPDDHSERAALSRARAKVRRYAAHNLLTAFMTLTAARPGSEEEFAADVRNVLRSLSRQIAFPSIWTLERSDGREPPSDHQIRAESLEIPSGHLHAHLLVPASRVAAIAGAWYQREERSQAHGAHARFAHSYSDIRAAAGYLTKDFHRSVMPGARRYIPAPRFTPLPVKLTFGSAQEALEYQERTYGAATVWRSDDAAPSRWLSQWDETLQETTGMIDGLCPRVNLQIQLKGS